MSVGRLLVSGVEAVGGVLDELITSDEERAKVKLAFAKLADAPEARRDAITLQEAKHPSPWVSGWRPAVGWACASGLFFAFVVWPIAATIGRFFGVDIGEMPFNTGILITILTALLGSSGLRTWEKYKGVARNSMKG